MSKPQAVIFDIGNVLIEWNPERLYDSVIGPDRRRAMFAEVDLHAMNDRVDRGHNWLAEVQATAGKHPAWADEIMLWHDRWIEMASPVIPHSIRLMNALQANGVPVFALTNFGVESFDYAIPHYPFLGQFDRAYVSGRMRVSKPEPEIYAQVEADCGLPPGDLIFADDRPENIAAAAARGWRTHLFTTPQGWADRLVAEGLLKKDEAQ
ncbi:MAG: HAD family phosphatase [Rhodobacterales bacterium]|nr:HAD family phosphatase [Rhodobacterales bacterium]